jgi:hypothetical protein
MSDVNNFQDHRYGASPGWLSLIDQVHAKLLELDSNYRVDQIKSKFGGLRYYFTASEGVHEDVHEKMLAIVHQAESDSVEMCEACGEPGKNESDRGWWRTLCDAHRAELHKAYDESARKKRNDIATE